MCLETNMHNNDACLINFTAYLFSCVKFSWTQLTLKIYYRRKFPDLRYIYVLPLSLQLLITTQIRTIDEITIATQ